MPLGRGAQAQDETQRAGRNIRLIRVRHHRGIEQRRGFERILVSEISAQQQLPFFGQSLTIEQIGTDLVKSALEEFVDLQLAVAEFGPDRFQKGMDFAFGQSHHPGGDLYGALVAHQSKRPGQHVRAVGVQSDGAARYVDLFHWVIEAASVAGGAHRGVLCQPHFRKGQEEGQRRFRSLVFVAPVRVQPIAAAASLAGVEFQPEVVRAEEPVEGALRLSMPPRVGCGAVRFQASRNRGLRLDGLLVEFRACAVAPIESVAANRPQLAVRRCLYAHQPAQRLYAPFVHVFSARLARPLTIRA